MDLIAKLPQIAAMIYRKEFKGGDFIEPHPQLDWAANLSYMMGGCLCLRLSALVMCGHTYTQSHTDTTCVDHTLLCW